MNVNIKDYVDEHKHVRDISPKDIQKVFNKYFRKSVNSSLSDFICNIPNRPNIYIFVTTKDDIWSKPNTPNLIVKIVEVKNIQDAKILKTIVDIFTNRCSDGCNELLHLNALNLLNRFNLAKFDIEDVEYTENDLTNIVYLKKDKDNKDQEVLLCRELHDHYLKLIVNNVVNFYTEEILEDKKYTKYKIPLTSEFISDRLDITKTYVDISKQDILSLFKDKYKLSARGMLSNRLHIKKEMMIDSSVKSFFKKSELQINDLVYMTIYNKKSESLVWRYYTHYEDDDFRCISIRPYSRMVY